MWDRGPELNVPFLNNLSNLVWSRLALSLRLVVHEVG
jgi:hypothetical protein